MKEQGKLSQSKQALLKKSQSKTPNKEMQIPQVGWTRNEEIDSSLDEDENSDVEGKPGMKKCRHCGKEFTN